MKEQASHARRNVIIGLSVVASLLAAGLAYGGYQYWLLKGSLAELQSQFDEASSTLASQLAENAALHSSLISEQQRNNDFENQINGITSTVTKIDKLQQTDPQLLAKYSKVYFLSDTYVPKDLEPIPSSFVFPDKKDYKLIPQTETKVEDMIRDAADDGVNLEIISAYRSFSSQASLKVSYKVTYGSGANAFSADQGYSEHQLGTAVDFTTKELGADFSSFGSSSAYAWLTKNAYKYGFVLSYPSGNSYYVFEPWHWRYVSIALARDLHNEKKYFYQLDQRTINDYLIDFANEN